MSNCSISRNVAELEVSQMAVLVLSIQKKCHTEMKFICEKSVERHLGFSFFLVLNKCNPSSRFKIEKTKKFSSVAENLDKP